MPTKPRDLIVGLLFVLITGWFAYNLYQLGLQQDTASDRLTTVGRLLGTTLGACAAFYFLILKQSHEKVIELLRGEILKNNSTANNSEQAIAKIIQSAVDANLKLAIEPRLLTYESQAKAIQKHNDLMLEEDFRRRERRDTALIAFSKSANSTTRAFRQLCRFRMLPGMHSEQLVNALAPALGARQAFLTARDELDDLHVVQDEHEKAVRAYSNLLINIIIDVRRTEGQDLSEYDRTMSTHLEDLERQNSKLGTLLGFFLAPQKYPRGSPDRLTANDPKSRA